MVKLTGSPNYKIAEINRLLTIVEEHPPLSKDEWERVAMDYNLSRSRGWVERDLDSLRRKFKTLYSMRKPMGTAEMPPHVEKAKLAKRAIDDKANVVEMDDGADENQDEDNNREEEGLFVEPDFSFDAYYDEQDCNGDAVLETSAPVASSQNESQDNGAEDRPGAACANGGPTLSTPPPVGTSATFQMQLGGDGLEAFASTPQPAPLPPAPNTRQLRSAGLKKPRKNTIPRANSADDAASTKTKKLPAARGYQPGGHDEQEALRHLSLQSASNWLGGGNLYTFHDNVGSKRAKGGEDQDQAEASFCEGETPPRVEDYYRAEKKLSDLDNAGSNLGSNTFEMMLLFREKSERKLEARRVEEELRRRDEAAAKEARLQVDKMEAMERRRQDNLEADERVRRDKDDARARTQEMIMLIGAIFKKE